MSVILSNQGKAVPEGQYELKVMDTGDLSQSWTNVLEDLTLAISSPWPSAASDFGTGERNIEGDKSIIGFGLMLEAKSDNSQLKLKGVIGIQNLENSANGASTNVASPYATCFLQPLPSAPFKVTGQVWFSQTGVSPMKAVAKVSGLNRDGLTGLAHGIHVHTFGDLHDGGGTSVGGHFNPKEREHRLPGGDVLGHAGDLGNIAFYDNSGIAWYEQSGLEKQDLTSTTSILGRAVVIHSKMDNGCGQPTGDAGDKLAWCVIGIGKNTVIPKEEIPFVIPTQKGSSGCTLNNTPDAIPKSASFIWMVVIISIALAAIGLLFGYNWWKSRQNPTTTTTANGRQPWYAQQNEDEDDDGPTA